MVQEGEVMDEHKPNQLSAVMAYLGRLGGQAKSAAKTRACRANAAKKRTRKAQRVARRITRRAGR